MDLEIVIVSHGDGAWLEPCVESLARRAGDCAYRITIVENGDAPVPLRPRPELRVLHVANRGFGAANNDGAAEGTAPVLLFLNPDTELVAGSLERLAGLFAARPRVGLLAVRQVATDGTPWPSLHRFPSVTRACAAAFACERWPLLGRHAGERVLDRAAYERAGGFDWTTGAALAVRRAAFEAVGGFDERFFLFSEETDLCRRLHDARWQALLEPGITVVHHAGKAGVDPAREAQMAFARLQYACKHFGRARATAYWAALVLHHAMRLAARRARGEATSPGTAAASLSLRVLLGRARPPYRPMTADREGVAA